MRKVRYHIHNFPLRPGHNQITNLVQANLLPLNYWPTFACQRKLQGLELLPYNKILQILTHTVNYASHNRNAQHRAKLNETRLSNRNGFLLALRLIQPIKRIQKRPEHYHFTIYHSNHICRFSKPINRITLAALRINHLLFL